MLKKHKIIYLFIFTSQHFLLLGVGVQVELDVDVIVVRHHSHPRLRHADGEVTKNVSEEVLDEDEVGLADRR